MPSKSYIPEARSVNVVVGHYGVGKTNFSLNWALDLAQQGRDVTLIDLDVVNPYFRSSDYAQMLEEAGVRVIAPILAGSSLDTPSISGRVTTVIEWAYAQTGKEPAPIVIIDVGGDDAGATVLGRFSQVITQGDYQMLYVVNKYRNLTQDPAASLEVLGEVQAMAHLNATGLVNNSHLRDVTEEETVCASLDFAQECAKAAGVPLVCTTAPESAHEWKNLVTICEKSRLNVYPVQMLVKLPWE